MIGKATNIYLWKMQKNNKDKKKMGGWHIKLVEQEVVSSNQLLDFVVIPLILLMHTHNLFFSFLFFLKHFVYLDLLTIQSAYPPGGTQINVFCISSQ